MTRFDDLKRRALLRGRDRAVCMPHGRGICRRACFIAMNVTLGLVAGTSAFAAQYQTAAQYQAAQYQKAQRQHQAPLQTQKQPINATASESSARTPILSGLRNLNKPSQQSVARPPQQQAQTMSRQNSQQEPQRLGVFGTRPLLSGFKSDATAPQGQDFHAQSQHLNAQNPGPSTKYRQNVGADSSYAPSVGALTQASSNPAEANEALAKVPWNLFPEKTRERFQQVASSPTMYRRLPMAGGRCNPELFDFFLTYPQTVVELWKQMGYDEVDMKQVGPASYVVSEKGGSSGRLTVLYQSAEVAVAHVSGVYRGAGLVRPVEGEAFLILQTRYTEDPELTPLVICRLDAFVDIKNPGVDLVARAFHSMLGRIADANFEQTLAFVDSVCQTAEQNPRQFQGVVAQLAGLSPEARRILAGKAFTVAQQAQRRQQGQVVDYQLLAKANDPNPGYARILSRSANRPSPNNATYAARSQQNSFQGYNSREEDDFFDTNDMNASFAESGFQRSGAQTARSIGSLGTSRNLNLELSDEFSLAEDDASEYAFELDEGESMMTGEEFLATQTPASLKAGAASSLAKIEVKPSKNPRAMTLLDEEEKTADTLYASAPSTALTTDDDLELTIDDEQSVEAPAALPFSNAPRASTRLPSTVRGLNPSGSRVAAPNAVSLADAADDDAEEAEDDEAEDDEVAKISIDENGVPILDFSDNDPEEVVSESAESANVSTSTDLDVVAISDDENALANDGFTPHDAEPDQLSSPEPVDDDFNDGGWTRSVLSNALATPKVKTTPTPGKSAVRNDEPVAERKRPVTRRYTPPLVKSNASRAVETIQKDRADGTQTPRRSQEEERGDRVASYRWSPVPDTFVVKTAAIDKDENTLGPKTAKFTKPEIR